MPTALRGAIIALTMFVMVIGVALVAVAAFVSGFSAGLLVLDSLAVCGLTIPPLIAGSFASYWSWDASARTRLRTWTVVLLVVQVAGAAGTIVLTAGSRPLLPAVVLLVVLSAGLGPACIALGRTARRIELREQEQEPAATGFDALTAGPIEIEAFRSSVSIGWRRGVLGGGIGLAIGLVFTTLLLLVGRGLPGSILQAITYAPGGAGIGASVGMLTVLFPLSRRARDLLGGDYATARRIGRAVTGKAPARSAEEADRARVYAAVAPTWLRFQTAQTFANLIGIDAIAIGSFGGLVREQVPGAIWVVLGIGVLLVALVVLTVALRSVQLRRVRRYATEHPLPV